MPYKEELELSDTGTTLTHEQWGQGDSLHDKEVVMVIKSPSGHTLALVKEVDNPHYPETAHARKVRLNTQGEAIKMFMGRENFIESRKADAKTKAEEKKDRDIQKPH